MRNGLRNTVNLDGKFLPRKMVRLYRAVSEAELQDIRSFCGFRPGRNSVQGKYFADNLTNAAEWGRKFFKIDQQPFYIVYFDIPSKLQKVLFQFPNLDAIGTAWFADEIALAQINQQCSAILDLPALPR